MLTRIFNRCWMVVVVFIFSTAPLWAAEEEVAERPVWVLSYALIILFLTLTLLILLRPTKRDDSAFSFDEQKAQKEEEIKKIKGAH